MRPLACAHEHEVVRAVLMRRWPDSVDQELRSHAETCANCAEVITVAAVLGQHRDETLRDIHVPAAGQVWWRAALRAHAEAAHAARRPMVWLQGIAGASAVGLGVALTALAWRSLREAATWSVAFGSAFEFDFPNIAPVLEALRPGIPLALAVIACLVLTPLVVYFALSDDR
jgi:hypothetical protein